MLSIVQSTAASAFPSDLGWFVLEWRENRLRRLSIGHPSCAAALACCGEEVETAEPPREWRQLADRLQAYASGTRDDFRDVQLDLDHLTPFQGRVVQHCRRISWGKTLSYGELAAKAGSPRAARAVGSVMAQNRFPILVPCHRVVAAAGAIGGFSAPSGISLKQRMLKLEGWNA